MKLAICGDSHVISLARAYEQRDRQLPDFPAPVAIGKTLSFPETLDGPIHHIVDGLIEPVSEKMARGLSKLTGFPHFSPDYTYVLSMVFTTTILIRSTCWASHLPSRVARDGFQPVSDGVMEAIVLDHFRHSLALIEALREADIAVLAMESPMPRRDDPSLRKMFAPEDAQEIDRMARVVIRRRLAALDVDVIAAPAEAIDSKHGFLAKPYHAETASDYHHANAAFGAMALTRVTNAVTRHWGIPAG